MGDRTYVRLTVLESRADEAETIVKTYDQHADREEADGGVVVFSFEEVNYGELPFLPQLQALGIAYDSEWDKGDNYGAGGDYCRFYEDGSVSIQTQYEGDDTHMPLHLLKPYLNHPEMLKTEIERYMESCKVPGWENQEEYGRRYQTTLLLQK